MVIDSGTITHLLCFGAHTGSITVHAHHGQPGIIHYKWSNSDTTVTISGLSAGSYQVTASDDGGCTASATYTITQPSQLVNSLSNVPYVCFGMSNGRASVSPSGGTPGYTYLWSNNVTSSLDTTLSAGLFKVTVTDAHQCSVSASGTILQDQLSSSTDTVIPFKCGRPPYGNVTITTNAGVSPFNYHIINGSSNSTGQFNGVAPGEYGYTVTDSAGCSVSGGFFVPEGYAVDSFTIFADSTSCFGLRDGDLTVTPVITPNQPYTFSINNETPQLSGTFDSLGAGDYQVIVRNSVGCYDTLFTTVYQPAKLYVNINPDTATIINGDTSDLLSAIIGPGFVSPVYFWTPSTGLSCTQCINNTATVYDPTVTAPSVYYVYVTDSLNSACGAYDSVIILIKGQFQMPDAFTPNGDGKNDLFGPALHSYVAIKEFHIYNRWGQLVHNSTDLWDGNFKGEPQPAATYVYYIVVDYPNPINPSITVTKKLEGSVVLLR